MSAASGSLKSRTETAEHGDTAQGKMDVDPQHIKDAQAASRMIDWANDKLFRGKKAHEPIGDLSVQHRFCFI